MALEQLRPAVCSDYVAVVSFSFSEGSLHAQPIPVIMFSILTECIASFIALKRLEWTCIAAAAAACIGWACNPHYYDMLKGSCTARTGTLIEWFTFFIAHIYARRWSSVMSASGAPTGLVVALIIQCSMVLVLRSLRFIVDKDPDMVHEIYGSLTGLASGTLLIAIPWCLGWRRFHINTGVSATIAIATLSVASAAVCVIFFGRKRMELHKRAALMSHAKKRKSCSNTEHQ